MKRLHRPILACVPFALAIAASHCGAEYVAATDERSAWRGTLLDDGEKIAGEGSLTMYPIDPAYPDEGGLELMFDGARADGSTIELYVRMAPPTSGGPVALADLGAQMCVTITGPDPNAEAKRCESIAGTITSDYVESDCEEQCLVDIDGTISVTDSTLFEGEIDVTHHEEREREDASSCLGSSGVLL